MEDYPADTNAAAVILADYGTVSFERGYNLVFKRHRRIKILRETGYDWGTFAFSYHARDRLQEVNRVEGQTFLMQDGWVQRHELNKGDIFKEDLDGDFKRIRFTLPALAPGAVIEYRYEVQSKSPVLMPEWSFQASEPTLWSEFRPEIPLTLHYVQATRGILQFHIEESEKAFRPVGQSMVYRLVMRDVPAIREEPYMTTAENYRARLEYQLASYLDPGFGVRTYMQTWAVLAQELMEHNDFGRQLDRPRRVMRDQVAALIEGKAAPLEKMQALYDYVRTSIEWNGDRGYLLGQDLDAVLTARKGSSPEMALLLIAMLREAGLEAHPVLISTRQHGFVVEQYPLLRQFNDVLVYVEAGGKAYLLNATDPVRPYHLLPYESLNGRGWLVRKDNARWIDVATSGKYVHLANVEATLAEDGAVTGTLRAADDAYSGVAKRRTLRQEGGDPFVRNVLLKGLADVQVDSVHIAHEAEVDRALETTVAFTVPAYAQTAGDFLYVNPVLIDRVVENPLKPLERTFPVDFGYSEDVLYTMRLRLPEGFEVRERPGYVRIPLPDNGGAFTRSVEVQSGVLVVQTRLVRTKAIFQPRYYGALREAFDRLVAAQAEQVVLERVTQATGD